MDSNDRSLACGLSHSSSAAKDAQWAYASNRFIIRVAKIIKVGKKVPSLSTDEAIALIGTIIHEHPATLYRFLVRSIPGLDGRLSLALIEINRHKKTAATLLNISQLNSALTDMQSRGAFGELYCTSDSKFWLTEKGQ